jgi:type I restriction enzyme S subunit
MFGRPSLPEQQKIADCLSSLDELIDAEDKKLEALRLHKKGLMQELFPGEGQTLPKLRFPEFQSAPEWEEKTLGKISNTLQGYGFPEKHQGVTEGIYPFYKVSDISNSLHRGENFIKQAVNYIDETTLKTLKAKLLPVGTTIFAKIGEAIRLNRRVITTVPCLIDNNVAGLKRIEGQATDLFLYYILLRINLAEHCGGAVPSVNKSTIEAIPVICPEPEEQKKIAEFLSSVDNLITSQNQKLESLRLHKKGLMQQLFPNASEVQE